MNIDLAKDDIFCTVDGKEYCDEDRALGVLLVNEVCMVSAQDYIAPWDATKKTCAIVVLCNDLFWWATADAEELPQDQIETLYRMWLADKKWGPSKWCCRRHNLRPQVPIVEMMKKDGAWDAEMEALPAPEPS